MAQASVFEQVIQHISKKRFQTSVTQHQGDKKIRNLDCWTWFGALLFGQLTGHDSIRAMERAFGHGCHRFKKLKFSSICRSTLSDANHVRPLQILRDTLEEVIQSAKQLQSLGHGFRFSGEVFALDSTIIDLCLSLSPWANFRRGTAAVKLHTAIDLAGDLPQVVVITQALVSDITVAKTLHFSKGSTVVMDRGYWASSWFNHLNDQGIYFVTRQRRNNRFRVVESRPTDRTQGYLCDQIVYQIDTQGNHRHQYKGKLRRISYKDPKTQKRLTFLTNRWDLATSTICKLYKARWKVELFFKTLKQNLKIKKFLGTTAHAVTAQILVALIAYVLIQILRFQTKSHISIPDVMAVVGTLLLLHLPVSRLLGALPRRTRHPPNPQLSFIF